MSRSLIQKTALLFAVAASLVATGGLGCNKNALSALDAEADAVIGDYGDAPDTLASGYASGVTGDFPTRHSRNGAHHLDTADSAFGAFTPAGALPVSAEKGAVDAADPDGAQNIDEPTGESDHDALDDGLLSPVVAPGVLNAIDFVMSVAAGAPGGTRYVNMAVDWNQDGEWRNEAGQADEWIVVNMPADVAPGTSAVLTTPAFTGGANANAWLRMTLSEAPIDVAAFPDGWDGTGEFAKGETEDYLLEDRSALDLVGKLTGGGGPGGGPGGGGPGGGGPGGGGPGGGGPGGGGPGGGGTGGGACEYYKTYNATLCKGQSRNFLALVDDFAPDSVTAVSSDPSVASVSVNEANVTVMGDAVGSATVTVTVTSGDCVWHITINVTVKDCSEKKAKIDCCSAAEIAKDPSRCKNCHAVGWAIYTNETPGGGGDSANGGIELTGSHGNTDANLRTKTTVVRIGNVIKVIVTFYECDPCPEDDGILDDDGDCDDDRIPDEEDWFPAEQYDPEFPRDYEEQQYVDAFFDAFFDVNTSHEVYDERDFSEDGYTWID